MKRILSFVLACMLSVSCFVVNAGAVYTEDTVLELSMAKLPQRWPRKTGVCMS